MNGALLIDKPQGLTSHDVVARVRRTFAIAKVGHAGTLDPMAEGLLIVLCGKATRLQSLLMNSPKTYEGVIRLGIATDSDDMSGKVIEERTETVYLDGKSRSAVVSELEKAFCGEQMQIPPAYSAVSVAGERSYALARVGKPVQLSPRKIFVKSIELRFIDDRRLGYQITCSKGTYVRALARDIGKYLHSCACLESIRRTESGPFHIDQACALDCLLEEGKIDRRLIRIEELVEDLPKIGLRDEECVQLRRGDQTPLRSVRAVSPGSADERYVPAQPAATISFAMSRGEVQGNRETLGVITDSQGQMQGLAQYVGPRESGGEGFQEWRIRFLL